MKNIITNILGIISIITAIIGILLLELSIPSFLVLVGFGAVLFYFENKTIKKYLVRLINIKLKE
tara:strand:- start:2012 stop:2203 length:192 start_codon:yes stop_codon:yes gene_type:complete